MTKVALESHTFRNLEARDDAPLDLLAGLPGSLAGSPILPSGLIEMRDESVSLASIVAGPTNFRESLWPVRSGQSELHGSCIV